MIQGHSASWMCMEMHERVPLLVGNPVDLNVSFPQTTEPLASELRERIHKLKLRCKFITDLVTSWLPQRCLW